MKGFGSYEHLKFRPTPRLKYGRHKLFCYHCVEYIKLDICVKFHDHRSNNNNVMMGGGGLCPPSPMTDGSKKPMSNGVNGVQKIIQTNKNGHFAGHVQIKQATNTFTTFVQHSK